MAGKALSPELSNYLNLVAPHAATRSGAELSTDLGSDGQAQLLADILTGGAPGSPLSKERLLSKDRLRHSAVAFQAVESALAQVVDPLAFMLEVVEVFPELSRTFQHAALWALGTTPKTLARVCGSSSASSEVLHAQAQDLFQVIAEVSTSPAEVVAAYRSLVKDAVATSIRGSVKSRNGKYLESLTLGAVLSIGGLARVSRPDDLVDGSFCLSDAAAARDATVHEADATVLSGGVLIKIDAGFVGFQNPEVVHAKFSRFPDTPTIVLVDSAPAPGSAISKEATALGVELIAMDSPTWLVRFYNALTTFAPTFVGPLSQDASAAEVRELVAASLKVTLPQAPATPGMVPGQLPLLDAA